LKILRAFGYPSAWNAKVVVKKVTWRQVDAGWYACCYYLQPLFFILKIMYVVGPWRSVYRWFFNAIFCLRAADALKFIAAVTFTMVAGDLDLLFLFKPFPR
jgi:hypothetical protein